MSSIIIVWIKKCKDVLKKNIRMFFLKLFQNNKYCLKNASDGPCVMVKCTQVCVIICQISLIDN